MNDTVLCSLFLWTTLQLFPASVDQRLSCCAGFVFYALSYQISKTASSRPVWWLCNHGARTAHTAAGVKCLLITSHEVTSWLSCYLRGVWHFLQVFVKECEQQRQFGSGKLSDSAHYTKAVLKHLKKYHKICVCFSKMNGRLFFLFDTYSSTDATHKNAQLIDFAAMLHKVLKCFFCNLHTAIITIDMPRPEITKEELIQHWR